MIEKILNEISRLKKELKGYSASEALDYIESYINAISKEPGCEVNFTTKNENLEEAANQHSKQVFHGLLVEDNITAFKAGAEWQKQQMMKDAVEGEIILDINGNIRMDCADVFHIGDKIKIIPIKTKQQ